MGRKIAIVVGYGQSNEQGSAVTGSGAAALFKTLYGFPFETTGKSGPFHVLAQQLGSEGHCVWLRNMALGGTGVMASWNGQIRTWIASTTGFAPGSWVIPTVPNGYKYLAGGTPGVSQSSGASQPAWPTVVDATVVDGGITWTCKAQEGKEVAGYVHQWGDTGYDPKGYIASFLAAIADAKAKGFEVWVMTSGHQNDYGNSAAAVSGVLVNLMRRVLALNPDRLYLGVTNRFVGDASAPQWDAGGFYPTVRNLTYEALRSDPRVLLGADLSVINSTVYTDPAGAIHLNDAGALYCGQLWRNAITV